MLADFDRIERNALLSPSGFAAWCETHARIKDKAGKIVPLRLNHLQRQVAEAVEWCRANKRPMRFLMLKPRQKGSSTINTAVCDYLSNIGVKESLIVGGQLAHSDNLWKMLRRYAEYDQYQWFEERPQIGDKVIRWPNGSLASKGTANDPEEGRSGTYQVLICTEAARWSEQGVANATDVLTGLMACVPYEPDTLICLETTARGPSGVFFDLWTDKETQWLHEAQQHDNGGFIKIFSPWFAFSDSRDSLSPEQEAAFRTTLTQDELAIMGQYGLDIGQLSWRRRTIRTECKRDKRIFGREYPANPEEAFAASSPSYFSADGLAVLRQRAQKESETRLPALLEAPQPDRVALSKVTEEESMWWIYEQPVAGRRYLVSADFMQGLTDDERGDNRDHHAVIVLQQGYMDPHYGWKRPKVVARTVWPCQWADDILEEQIWRAHLYYGRCMVVPEANIGTHIVRGLVNRGAIVWEQTRGLDASQETRTLAPTGKFGFRTTGGGEQTAGTKRWILENLARAVREWDVDGDGIECDNRTIREMEVFVRHVNGKLEAMKGEHDDSVMALAIGFACLDAATLFRPPLWHPGAGGLSDPMLREMVGGMRKARRVGAHGL